MGLYDKVIFRYLRSMDPEDAHNRAVQNLERAQDSALGRWLLRRLAGSIPHNPVKAFGLTFPNVLGVAAGFDKDVRIVLGLGLLGFGHVETGTLTPEQQPGNPRPRVFRLTSKRAVINRMGFPNCGAANALPRLQKWMQAKDRPIIGVSVGKQKDTPLAYAIDDYKKVMRVVYDQADYIAVNISSPNTPGLRELQGSVYLENLLHGLTRESQTLAKDKGCRQRPILVKIAPDMSWAELDDVLSACTANRIHGIIATNTTLSRDGVDGESEATENGGLSGRPLARRSTEIVAYIYKQTAGRLPVIGVGGIETARDVREKLDAGATLVQVYTGMIYQGPRMAGRILRQLA